MSSRLVLGAICIALTSPLHANPVKEYGTMCTLYVNNIKVPTDALRADECRSFMESLAKKDKTGATLKCSCMDGGKV